MVLRSLLDIPLRFAGVLFLSTLALAACAEKGLVSGPQFATRQGKQPLHRVYRLAIGDKLKVSVFGEENLSGTFEVNAFGQVSMPLIGEVQAFNLTTAELDQRLTEKLGEKYLQNPDVSVGIKSSTRRSVTVDGAVKSPGSFPVAGGMSLIQAVAQAGGMADDGNVHRIAVFRQIGGRRQAAAFDLGKIRKGEAQDPAIYAGDIIVVDGSAIKKLQKSILNTLPLLSIFKPF